ncbi:hypothetical protein F5J12DRAFT_786335 [Pisolithus orientalis]|uniref:uncharacterized protein n=1 Tax=Pisolithus orientalis TaxID=936130 RepID=UPI002224AD26|nr:uncharacterized protein F5J12DRAFT_786335 [Pisolithus orientalis]KAI5991694.1 hypothetical protein F5J12DRAFT_786335 [Pisolithus orientalis]
MDDSMDDSLDDHGKAEASDVGTDGPSTKKVSGGRQNHAKTPFPSHSHSNPPPADGSHIEQLSAPPAHAKTLQTLICTQGDHSEYADEDGLESILFTDHPTEEGSTSRKKGGKLKSALKCTHKASSVMLNQLLWLTSLHCILSRLCQNQVSLGAPGSHLMSERSPARPDADVLSPDAQRLHKQTGNNQKQK